MAESKLTDLIAKLEAAAEGSHELNRAMGLAIGELHLDAKGDLYRIDRHDGSHTYGGSGDETIITPRWTTSLDAIVALIERKLPGWGGMVSFGALTCGATLHTADLWGPVTETGETEDGIAIQLRPEEHGENRKPALALCVALLSALQLQGGSEQ